jgi:hypothetical protein
MWKHRRTQNAFTIATFTGILTTAAIAFLHLCIPNPLARASAIKNIRIAWLEYAYTAWRRHRNLMRSKDAARKYIRKRKGKSRPIGKDPPRPRNSKAQRADDPIPSMHHQSGEDQQVDDLNLHDPEPDNNEPEWIIDDEDHQADDEEQEQHPDLPDADDSRSAGDSDSDWHEDDVDEDDSQEEDDDDDSQDEDEDLLQVQNQAQDQDQDQDQDSSFQASDQDQDIF